MAPDNSLESIFRENSLEEVKSIRDHLAREIEKRTDQLKSIVKEKYRDIVETSDAIQSMKLNLKEVEQSFWSLDKRIAEFYSRIKEPKIESIDVKPLNESNGASDRTIDGTNRRNEDIIRTLLHNLNEMWEDFDSDNLKMSVELMNKSTHLLESNSKDLILNHEQVVGYMTITLKRAREMIMNDLWHKIQVAAPDQIGVITGSDQKDLYNLCLSSSIAFLVKKFRNDISDTSYKAQIRRYQPWSYFNTETNEIEPEISDLEAPATGYVQIPKKISPELNAFLFNICQAINTIAGFNLNRSTIVDSLRMTLQEALGVYEDLVPIVSALKAESRRKRSLQLYFDVLYLRSLLNTSKSIELIEEVDPKIVELCSKFEVMLDSIELYMISAALHSNVMAFSQSTIRLKGLLIPHLQ